MSPSRLANISQIYRDNERLDIENATLNQQIEKLKEEKNHHYVVTRILTCAYSRSERSACNERNRFGRFGGYNFQLFHYFQNGKNHFPQRRTFTA